MSVYEFFDEFTRYVDGADLTTRWTSQTGSPTVSANGRGGRQGLEIGANASTSQIGLKKNFTAQKTVSFGFWYKLAADTDSTDRFFFTLVDVEGTTTQVSFSISSSAIKVYRNAPAVQTLLGTASFSPNSAVDRTMYFEGIVTIGHSDGAVQLWVNDGSTTTQLFDLSGIDTQETDNAYVNRAVLWNINVTTYWDDVYVRNDGVRASGGAGLVYVDYLPANAAGNYGDFDPNTGNDYEAVDEVVADDDTTYVSAASSGDKSSFGCGDLSDVGTIQCVTPIARTRVATGSGNIKIGLRVGGSDYVASAEAVSTAYTWKEGTKQDVNPATAANWLKAGVNASEVYMEVSA